MAKLYFRFGAMGCSKTANALMVAFNYTEKGLNPLVLKPAKDTRDPGVIKSRIGLSRPCKTVEDVIKTDWDETRKNVNDYDCIIVDEVQFCETSDIAIFRKIVTELHIPIMCYGLREDFLQRPFKAAKELLGCADVIEELKTVCWCGQGAQCNARLDDHGNVVRSGQQIVVGGNERYTSLCRTHYLSGDIGPVLRAKYNSKENSK